MHIPTDEEESFFEVYELLRNTNDVVAEYWFYRFMAWVAAAISK